MQWSPLGLLIDSARFHSSQIRALSWEHDPGLPLRWQEPNGLSHKCCLPGSKLEGSWTREPE